MLKKLSVFIVLFSLVVPALCLGQSMPSEVKTFTLRFFKEMTSAQQTLSAAVSSAASPDQIASAIDAYTDSIEPLIDAQVALETKYPEFYASVNRMDDDDVLTGDAEIDKAQEQFDSAQNSFEEIAMTKIMRNYANPQVNAAMTRLQQVMSRMDIGDDDDNYDDDE
jgi:hypothetical protein